MALDPDQSHLWPWGRDRPGVAEWRRNVSDPAGAERRLLESVQEALANAPHPGGHVSIEDVRLEGEFPLTELVTVFKLEPRFSGRSLGYRTWIWDDPDSQQLFTVYFDEALNDFAQAHTDTDADALPDDVVWLSGPT